MSSPAGVELAATVEGPLERRLRAEENRRANERRLAGRFALSQARSAADASRLLDVLGIDPWETR